MKRWAHRLVPSILFLLVRSVDPVDSSTEGSSELFPCLNLSDAHYNYLKTPGESVNITCPKNCTAEGHTQWYHSYVKVKTDMSLLVWSGSSHEAAVKETPTHGSVGWFCCVCEEEEDPAENGCCWGVAYQPVVDLSITTTEGLTADEETVVPVGTNVSLRCEARGFPRISVDLSPPEDFNSSLLAQCHIVEKSWYSSVLMCYWTTASERDSGVFECTGTIIMDSVNDELVEYNESAYHQLSIYPLPRLVRLYQSSKLEVGSPLDIECEIDCSPVAGCSVTWYFEGVAVDPEGGKYDISSVDGLVHRLSLEDPGKEDLGRYACVLRSRFSTTEDSMTITVTIPDGAEPSPLKDLPGPDRDDGSLSRTTTETLAAFSIVILMGMAVLLGVVYLVYSTWKKQRSAASSREGMESADTDGLIRSDDSIQTDGAGAAVSPKEKSKRTRHRPSAKK